MATKGLGQNKNSGLLTRLFFCILDFYKSIDFPKAINIHLRGRKSHPS